MRNIKGLIYLATNKKMIRSMTRCIQSVSCLKGKGYERSNQKVWNRVILVDCENDFTRGAR